MNNAQPKPTTGEQEWPDAPVMTERQQQIVKDLAVKIVNHANTSVRERLIAVAINAALAAEQEKADNLFKVARKHCIENKQLRSELAAAQAAIIEATGMRLHDRKALDAAIAAAVQAKAHEWIERSHRLIAVAQQPLVDALKLCLSAIRHEPGSSEMRACIEGDLLLAKAEPRSTRVKEGK